MKTLPIEVPKMLNVPAHSLSKPRFANSNDIDDKTDVISYTNIKNLVHVDICSDGPVNDLDCNLNFSFEKDRLKHMENTILFASVNKSNACVNMQVQVLKEAELNLKVITNQYNIIDLILYWTRNVSIIFCLIFTLEIVGAFFGILMTSSFAVLIYKYIIFLSLEIASSFAFLYLSIKMLGLNRITIRNSQRIFKFCLIFFISLIVTFIASSIYNSLGTLLSSIKDKEADGREKTICIILICSYFFIALKIAITSGYIIIWIIAQVILKRIDRRQGVNKG